MNVNILFQSTAFRIKKEQKQRFEEWFGLFEQMKGVELNRLSQEAEDCYQFTSSDNHSFFSQVDPFQTMEKWMEEFATYLPEDEVCWVLETSYCPEALDFNHQAVKITSQQISNHSLEEFVYREEKDTLVDCYRRVFQRNGQFVRDKK